MLVPDPARPVSIGLPPARDGDRVQWLKWPTNKPIPNEAFTKDGLLVTASAKLRPCLVLTLRDEIDAFEEAHVLPISAMKEGPLASGLIRANQVPYSHFLPGDPTRWFDDATVDFRWTWRVRVADLAFGRHEAELDPETLVRLLMRYRDYLYMAGT